MVILLYNLGFSYKFLIYVFKSNMFKCFKFLRLIFGYVVGSVVWGWEGLYFAVLWGGEGKTFGVGGLYDFCGWVLFRNEVLELD